ncbi:MAG: PorV/PorQ family protein [candidate division WOR-3 bacterium]
MLSASPAFVAGQHAFVRGQRPGFFLLIHPSARAAGMAYALTAAADDAMANYYNGAGLAFSKTPSISTSYLGYLTALRPDMHYSYLGISYPMVSSAWGFDLTFITLGETETRDSLGQYTGTALVWRIAPKLSYAQRVIERLSLGISWKFIQHKFMWDFGFMPELGWVNEDTRSWAFDFSLQYRPLQNLAIGAVVHNIGPDFKYESSGATDPLPRLTRLGIAYVPVDTKNIECTISCELSKLLVGLFRYENKTFWQNLKYEFDMARKAISLELMFYRMFSLCAGYVYDNTDCLQGFTFGGGIQYKNLRLDIGIDEIVYEFPTQNRVISLSYYFD